MRWLWNLAGHVASALDARRPVRRVAHVGRGGKRLAAALEGLDCGSVPRVCYVD